MTKYESTNFIAYVNQEAFEDMMWNEKLYIDATLVLDHLKFMTYPDCHKLGTPAWGVS